MRSTKPNLSLLDESPSTDIARDRHNQSTSHVNVDDLSLSSDADTIRLVALQYNEKLAIDEDPVDSVTAPFDPYNHTPVRSMDEKPRRSIDDLRKLSAEISKAKLYANKGK
jgi:hypothetical protein